MTGFRILPAALLFLIHYGQVIAACYFPPEFQGEFKMQSSTAIVGSPVQYSTLNITVTAIPIWGNCHRRIGNNFILMINYDDNSCIRCFHLKLRSKNVLQVHATSQDTISKCYINEESAVANCPSEESLRHHSTAEITLFKTKEMEGSYTKKEYCPIDGKFSVSYSVNDTINKEKCAGYQSSLDSCPSGSTLNLRFLQCNFESYVWKLDCLAHWEGVDGQHFLALADNRPNSGQSPQYRCALYKRNPTTGIINMALSRDSTCTTDLYNATHGYEILTLTPTDDDLWPPEVSFSQCSFPDWMVGNWEHVRVDDNTLVYKDPTSFKTYTIKCVGMFESEDKYLVFSRTQCGNKKYRCMRIQNRSHNIMEFQLGLNVSDSKDIDLCADVNFEEGAWITQGRLDRITEASCPISGEYTGIIPNTTYLCAKLWSDCRAPELMYYQVSECETGEVYEEREYSCLGHWRESELLYTYTQRRDVAAGTFECFVGSIISDKEDIYIKEAGEHCQRRINPLRFGMKLIKKGLYSCIGHVSTKKYEASTTKPIAPVTTPHLPTKPWNLGVPYPTIPDTDTNNLNGCYSLNSLPFILFVSIFVIISL